MPGCGACSFDRALRDSRRWSIGPKRPSWAPTAGPGASGRAPAMAGFFRIPAAVALVRAYAVVVAVAAASRAPLAMLTRELEFKRRFIPEGTGGVVGGLVTIVLAVMGVGVWSLLIGDLVREVI